MVNSPGSTLGAAFIWANNQNVASFGKIYKYNFGKIYMDL